MSDDSPITGRHVPVMESFDSVFPALMEKYQIPGGQVAVVKDGRLIYARAFGYADKDAETPVKPEMLFRVASVSKSITAVAVMKLIEEGKLGLDDKAFKILDDLEPPPGAKVDERLYNITVRNLLEHTGGRTYERDGDQQVAYLRLAADVLGEPRPADQRTIIRYVMGIPLDYAPGTQSVYNNFGYNVLGRIIEYVSGRSYEAYVKSSILAPAGITDMHLARTRLMHRRPNEVRYYDYPDSGPYWSLFDQEQSQITMPYGGDFSIEAMDAHGGWLASAVDLVKFVSAVDDRSGSLNILRSETIRLMLERPDLPQYAGKDAYYAKGWDVDAEEGNWRHAGALTGNSAFIMRAGKDGLNWAATFNLLPLREMENYFNELIHETFWRAAAGVKTWPEHDLFPQFAEG